MNAEIYYLEEQDGLVAGLAEALRAKLYPGFHIELHLIAFSNRRQVIDLGRRYVKLLQASIRPETGLQLGVQELDHYGYRFYIYVYHAFIAYSGGRPMQLEAFFPAIAVRNRMALVPAGLGKSLDWTSAEALGSLKPLEMGGASEVSFDDRPAVEDALARIAATVRSDLLQEIRAYAGYRKPGEISLTTLARDMHVDMGFLEHLFKTGTMERTFYRQLTCELTPSKITFDRWTKVILSVRNDSDVTLSGLEAKLSGPVEIRPGRIRLDVACLSTASVPISLKPTDRGEFPLEVVLALPDEHFFNAWLPVQHLWLECD